MTINRIMTKTNPWNSIDKAMEELINIVIMELNPELLDDDYPDAFDQWDNIEEAILYIKDKLNKKLKGEE